MSLGLGIAAGAVAVAFALLGWLGARWLDRRPMRPKPSFSWAIVPLAVLVGAGAGYGAGVAAGAETVGTVTGAAVGLALGVASLLLWLRAHPRVRGTGGAYKLTGIPTSALDDISEEAADRAAPALAHPLHGLSGACGDRAGLARPGGPCRRHRGLASRAAGRGVGRKPAATDRRRTRTPSRRFPPTRRWAPAHQRPRTRSRPRDRSGAAAGARRAPGPRPPPRAGDRPMERPSRSPLATAGDARHRLGRSRAARGGPGGDARAGRHDEPRAVGAARIASRTSAAGRSGCCSCVPRRWRGSASARGLKTAPRRNSRSSAAPATGLLRSSR